MARFFLCSHSRTELEAELKKANLDLRSDPIKGMLLRPAQIDEKDETNNPWCLIDPSRSSMTTPAVPGYSLSLSAKAWKLREIIKQLQDCNVAHVLGPEISIDVFHSTGSWQNWCPGGTFGERRHAHRLIGAQADKGLCGDGVNVIIVDRGLSRAYVERLDGVFCTLEDLNLQCHPPPLPAQGKFDDVYAKQPVEHGNMMVRNILALAPKAKIYDVPLIPRRIDDVADFAEQAVKALCALRCALEDVSGPCIIVNAWGIFDRFDEQKWGSYTATSCHPLNDQIAKLATKHDVIFSAGNSGQFCPDTRSGPYDRGPGNSILGANASPHVLSVGATRTDALWIGASSQGPGPSCLVDGPSDTVNEKPDLCAPSWFREDDDCHIANTGTSAACGVAAGVVAALRQTYPDVSPSDMRRALRGGARKFLHDDWNGRTGEGVINVAGTIEKLDAIAATS